MIDHMVISITTKQRMEIVDMTRNIEEMVEKSSVRNGFIIIWDPPHNCCGLGQ